MKKYFITMIAMFLPLLVNAQNYDAQIDGIYYYLNSSAQTAIVTYHAMRREDREGSYDGNVTIPSQVIYEGVTYDVTSIDDEAFGESSELLSVSIPNSVTSIGSKAFQNCWRLTSITLPGNLNSIGGSAFSGCSGLTAVISEIESPYDIDDQVFNGISSDAELIVPGGTASAYRSKIGWDQFSHIAEISGQCGDNVFYSYDVQTRTLTVYGEGAMYNYDVFTVKPPFPNDTKYIVIEPGVTQISGMVFFGYKNLISVRIPNTVTSIGIFAFYGCSSLTSIAIPNSVTSIGPIAFSDCSSLTTVISGIEDPYDIDDQVFYGIPSDTELIVPKGTLAKYQAAAGWKDFHSIKEKMDGDVNLDNKVNKNDLDALVAYIMGEYPEGVNEYMADVNTDEKIDAADVVTLIEIISTDGLGTESQLYFDVVDGSQVVSSLTCTLNNDRSEAIQLARCELYFNDTLVSYKNFTGSSSSVAAGGSKSCSFDNLAKYASATGFTVSWHYTANGESYAYRCPLTD